MYVNQFNHFSCVVLHSFAVIRFFAFVLVLAARLGFVRGVFEAILVVAVDGGVGVPIAVLDVVLNNVLFFFLFCSDENGEAI